MELVLSSIKHTIVGFFSRLPLGLALAGLFVVAVVFRLWFITLAPQPYAMDQEEYERFAWKIYDSPTMTAAHSFRSYPLPFLMASVYKLTGFANHRAIHVTNALLDATTAVFIFALLRWGFRVKRTAWIGAVLYSVNPFTSGYVGVLLSEVLTAFFITGTLLAGVLFVRSPRPILGFIMGICAGMAAETRNAAFVWAVIPLALTLFFVSYKRTYLSYIAMAVGITLTLLYPLYNNWRAYGEINATTVDSFYAKEFFQGALLKRLPPFTYEYPIESKVMWFEYYSEYWPGRTAGDRKNMAKKYFSMGWNLIKNDPWDYFLTRFDKMWYVWQKENIFFYIEPGFESHKLYTYILNLAVLGLAFFGLIRSLAAHMQQSGKWTWWAIVGSLFYATVGFSLTHAEYRLSIPFYPLLFVLAALGIMYLFSTLRIVLRGLRSLTKTHI